MRLPWKNLFSVLFIFGTFITTLIWKTEILGVWDERRFGFCDFCWNSFGANITEEAGQTHYKMISCDIWLPVVIHRSKTRNNALDVFWGIETIIVNLAFSWVLVKLQFQLMKVKNISPKLSARANYTFSGMTILQHEPAAAPKKVFLPCVSLPRANFYENIFYNAFAL